MGLIKAISSAVGSSLADQWKEYFYCEALDNDVLMKKGTKVADGKTSNTKGRDNVITDGSGIAVADGQCMLIVEDGKVVDICSEPGRYTFDSKTQPSVFTGNLLESVGNTFKQIGKRFTFGGSTGADQRVYYFNIKHIMDNKFGSANPIPFRVVDPKINLDFDASIKVNGIYAYKIEDPILFYTNVVGNVSDEYTREQIDPQLKTEFISNLGPAISKLSSLQIRPNEIAAHNIEIENAMNELLSQKWLELRGIRVVSIALNPITLTEEDQEILKTAQKTAVYKDPGMAAALGTTATAEAMKAAASNENGAMMGFMGMGMAMNQGNALNTNQLFQMSAEQQKAQAQQAQAAGVAGVAVGGWVCPKCGNNATGKFCPECGTQKPEDNGWTCVKCGSVNKGKFCTNCGEAKPGGALLYKCNKCGWEPEDPKNPPKFCPQCGDPFNEGDIVK